MSNMKFENFAKLKLNLSFFSILVVLLGLTTVSCTKKNNTTETKQPAQELNLAIWGNYISDEVIQSFFKSTGIKINISNYSSNEELLAKMQTGGAGIDLAVPSDYMVDIMIKQKLLSPLDLNQIPNKQNVESKWLNQTYDKGNMYSMPYAWATTGICINRDLYKGKISSWKELFASKDLDGKVSLLDDVREVTGAALKSIGYSLNSKTESEVLKAQNLLVQFKPKVKMFRSDIIDAVKNKEVAVAQSYSSDAIKASFETDGKIEYVIPSDGSTLSIDNMVIPEKAKHKEAAHKLINHLLSTDSNLSFVLNNKGGPITIGIQDKLPPELKNNKALFPDAKVLAKLEKIQDIGDATKIYDRVWQKVKSE
jgi:spermidine/putrescine transport system substrate-binding protein